MDSLHAPALWLLCGFATLAGLIDAVVGGGGLIQVPALFNVLPSSPPATLLGTNKFVGVSGTLFAARAYMARVSLPWRLLMPAALAAFSLSFVGAAAATAVPAAAMRPVVLVLLIAMTVYTLVNKQFGQASGDQPITPRRQVLALCLGAAIGFYDGLFGPGTGGFLIFLFVRCFNLNFVVASACSKVVNVATNVAALMYFIPASQVLYAYALPMALCNIVGAQCGAYVAMRGGAKIVRVLFIMILMGLITKLSIDIWHG